MFRLHDISLVQFRNYQQKAFSFKENIVGFCGSNGSGKTNLLDAIYYLCFTKSYFGKPDAQNVTHGKNGFRLEGHFLKQTQAYKTVCILRENNKKEFSVDDEMYTRFAKHIGKFPCVMIAPDDIAIITDASEERRKFLDYTISQVDSDYLQTLIDYNKILQQRNSLLKQFAESGKMDEPLIDIISTQLVQSGNIIFKKRNQFLENFIPMVVSLYHYISGNSEKLKITYQSHLLSASFATLLAESKARDRLLTRTTRGIHRDDLEFELDGTVFKTVASQGQRKSLLFALKLAEFEILLRHNGFPPILLLDDVFEKLDAERMQHLLYKVCAENKGQVFITDTHEDRLKEALDKAAVSYQLFELARQ